MFVGYKIRGDLEDRFDLISYPFTGKVEARVTAEGLSEEQAEKCSEFVERLTDNGFNQRLVVIAPHGGNIEKFTDLQADYVKEQFASDHISEWICKGFKNGGGAYDRWHVTSTDISENSFPKLKTIMGRHFEYSIAFHGWTKNYICIGESESAAGLKQEIKAAIEGAILGSGIDVRDSGCEDFNGDSEHNIVNCLGTHGIQIEQSEKARESYYKRIAEEVAKVMRPRIEV